jgi:DNA-binding beta-propeller fold protein YncE
MRWRATRGFDRRSAMKLLPTLVLTAYLFILPALRAEKIVLVAGGGESEAEAPATQCKLHEPFGAEFTPSGEMVIVEMEHGNRILKVDAQGVLHVIGGTGAKGYSGDGGPATAATFTGNHKLQITPSGDLLIADSFNHTLRKIDAKSGVVTTLAGNGKKGFAGDGGPAAQAQFSTLIQIALDRAGKQLFIADIGNKRIRKIDLASGTVSTVAGNGKSGVPTDGAVATEAPLVDPRAVTPDDAGGFYILERSGNALRHVDAAGRIKTAVGTGAKGLSGDGGPALAATMNGPKYITLDRDGSVLIADAENHVIRRYSPKSGLITRVAGTGKRGTAGLGGSPLECELARPHGVTVAKDGTLFITDSYNDRILKIVP